MRTIDQIRHARLLILLDSPEFPTIQSLASKIGKSHAQVSQWKNQSKRRNKDGKVTGVSNIDSESARWIEKETGKPVGWMDNDPIFDKRPIVVTEPRGDAPSSDLVDFEANDVTPSEYALLDDLRVMPEDELNAIRERAAKNRKHIDEVYDLREKLGVKRRQAEEKKDMAK